jgi:hypothetical protein
MGEEENPTGESLVDVDPTTSGSGRRYFAKE